MVSFLPIGEPEAGLGSEALVTLSDAIASEHTYWSALVARHRTALQSCALALESDFQQWLEEANARVEMLDQAAAAIRALEGERDAAIAALRAIAKDSGSTTRSALREHAADALASLDTEKAGG